MVLKSMKISRATLIAIAVLYSLAAGAAGIESIDLGMFNDSDLQTKYLACGCAKQRLSDIAYEEMEAGPPLSQAAAEAAFSASLKSMQRQVAFFEYAKHIDPSSYETTKALVDSALNRLEKKDRSAAMSEYAHVAEACDSIFDDEKTKHTPFARAYDFGRFLTTMRPDILSNGRRIFMRAARAPSADLGDSK